MTAALLAAEAAPPPYAAGPPATADDGVGDAFELIARGMALLEAQVLGGAVSDTALLDSVERLARGERRLAAERLRRIAELDERDAAPGLGARSTADLLAGRLGQTRGEARRDAETAAGLAQLPKTAQRLRNGDLGAGQAETAARAVGQLAGTADDDTIAALDDLVADAGPAQNRNQLRDTVERFTHQHHAEPVAARERRAHQLRRLHRWTDTTSGLRHYDLALPAAMAAVMDKAIDAAIARDRHRHRDGNDGDGEGDVRSFEQRGADALCDIAQHSLACPDVEQVAGGQTQVLVIVPPDGPAHLDGYGAVATATAQLLACDAERRAVVMRNGEVLDVGRSRRDPTPAQRAAVIARDRACVGCGAPVSRCQIHHIRWWGRDHGPTDEPNLVLVCWTCHDHIHHHGWTVTGDHIHGFAIQPPTPPPPLQPRQPARQRR